MSQTRASPRVTDQKLCAFDVFAGLCVRGDLTHIEKVNLLEELHRRLPGAGFGELAHALRILAAMTPQQREVLIDESMELLLRCEG